MKFLSGALNIKFYSPRQISNSSKFLFLKNLYPKQKQDIFPFSGKRYNQNMHPLFYPSITRFKFDARINAFPSLKNQRYFTTENKTDIIHILNQEGIRFSQLGGPENLQKAISRYKQALDILAKTSHRPIDTGATPFN